MTDGRDASLRIDEVTAARGEAQAGRLVVAGGRPWLDIAAHGGTTDLARVRTEGRRPRVTSEDGEVMVRYLPVGPIDWLREVVRPPRATICLAPSLPWSLEFPDGVHRLRAELHDLFITGIRVRGGVNRAELWLPWPVATVAIMVNGGVSSLRIHRPAGTPLRVSVGGGVSSLSIDGERSGAVGGSMRHESPNWAAAPDRLDVSVRGGVSSLDVC